MIIDDARMLACVSVVPVVVLIATVIKDGALIRGAIVRNVGHYRSTEGNMYSRQRAIPK